METLLAQATDQQLVSGFFDLIAKYGPEGAFYAVLAWLCWKYLPDVFRAHLLFVTDTASTQKQLADSFQMLTEREEGHAITHKALGHIAEGQKKQATDQEAKDHFDRAIDALE